MTKLFLILLFIVIASFKVHATEVSCSNLFQKYDSVKPLIMELIAPLEVKRRLVKQTFYNKSMATFVWDFLNHIDKTHTDQLHEILNGRPRIPPYRLGFSSINEARVLKEMVLNKQIRILSLIKAEELTPEFQNDFKGMVVRVYDPKATKKNILLLNDRLDAVILAFSENY